MEDMKDIKEIAARINPLFDRLINDIELLTNDVSDFRKIAAPVITRGMTFLVTAHLLAGGDKDTLLKVFHAIYDRTKDKMIADGVLDHDRPGH